MRIVYRIGASHYKISIVKWNDFRTTYGTIAILWFITKSPLPLPLTINLNKWNGISEIALRENGTTIAVSKMDSRQASSLGGYRFTCSINFIIEPNGSSDYYEIFASCFDNSGADAEVVHDSNGSIVFGAYKIIE